MSEAVRGDADASTASDGASDRVEGDGPGPDLGPPTAVESVVQALLEAGPDVADHVVKAAQELLLALQVIVDAADRAVKEQQAVHTERAPSDASAPDDSSVRHLDLAE
jgi:hypothetical protein